VDIMSTSCPSDLLSRCDSVISALEFRSMREAAGLSRESLALQVGYRAKTIQRWESGSGTIRTSVIEHLKRQLQSPAAGNGSGSFRFIDLFAGIGGLRRGFEPMGRCVFTSEWDRFAQITYRANFGNEPIAGDITAIRASEIPPHDLLLGGFPCQPFSIAGVSKKNALGRPHGFNDTQGTLFFDVARILDYHRPAAFLLENVKNLTTHDRGRTFARIRQVLEEDLGYQVSYRIIDARGFVPQHRERILIAGFREPVLFSLSDLVLPDAQSGPRLSSILHPEDGSEPPEEPYTDGEGSVSEKYVLSDHLWRYLQDYAAKHKARGNGFGFGLVGPDDVARTLSARYYKDGSEVLVRRAGNPRRLTPRECARLMGFDTPGEPPMRIPVSDTQAYRQFGNSVVVPVIQAVARAMIPHIMDSAPGEQLALPLSRSA
jgi:DNA (cytosine-5)-methyltransferase 1